jgi:hypothetical protein
LKPVGVIRELHGLLIGLDAILKPHLIKRLN